jgi:L-rhamnose mutarotase
MEKVQKITYNAFKRFCKTLTLRDDLQLIADYKKVHSPGETWPEISQGMREVGILNMEIYIFGTRLFMIMDTIPEFDHEKAMKVLATKPRQSEWEAYVSRFQNTSAEATADDKWQVMECIYEMNV